MNWYLKVLKQYVDFNGRARRKEFWMFILFNFIVSTVLSMIDTQLGFNVFGLSTVYFLGILLPYIAVGIRRIHDTGKTGWLILVPIYNLILFLTPGDEGENEYGPDPKAEDPFAN